MTIDLLVVQGEFWIIEVQGVQGWVALVLEIFRRLFAVHEDWESTKDVSLNLEQIIGVNPDCIWSAIKHPHKQ